MADIAAVVTEPDRRTKLVTWEAITHADQGASKRVPPGYGTRTCVATGTFGGGSYALEGSMDGVTFVPCYSAGGSIAAGSAIAFEAAGYAVVAGEFVAHRVVRTGGAAADVDIQLAASLGS